MIEKLIFELRTPARWNKAIQHLREAGKLEGSPKDIGLLIKEVAVDIEKKEAEYIAGRLYDHAIGHIRRGIVKGATGVL